MVIGLFPVGRARLCVDRALLRGVVEAPEITPAPLGPVWLVGAFNRAGRAVAVIDVAVLGGLATEPAPAKWVVVVETTQGPIGLLSEGPLEERRHKVPERTGDLLVAVEADTWLVDLARLPAAAESALCGKDDAV